MDFCPDGVLPSEILQKRCYLGREDLIKHILSNSSMRSITFSLWASTAMTSSRRTCSALTGPVACDNGFGLSHPIPQVSLGLNALVGAASASVFLDRDASLGLRCEPTAMPGPCLSGNTDINVTIGAQGSVFGLFDACTGNSHFDKNFRASSCLPGAYSQPTILLFLFFLSNIYHSFWAATAMLRSV